MCELGRAQKSLTVSKGAGWCQNFLIMYVTLQQMELAADSSCQDCLKVIWAKKTYKTLSNIHSITSAHRSKWNLFVIWMCEDYFLAQKVVDIKKNPPN